jgi:hypothetical protein
VSILRRNVRCCALAATLAGTVAWLAASAAAAEGPQALPSPAAGFKPTDGTAPNELIPLGGSRVLLDAGVRF